MKANTTTGFNALIEGKNEVKLNDTTKPVVMAARGSADKCCQVLSPSKFVWRENGKLVGITMTNDAIHIVRKVDEGKLLGCIRKVAIKRRQAKTEA